MPADNTHHLIIAARQRHELTRSKAIQALRELDRTGAPVTFQTVAQQASVSRSWLYTSPTSAPGSTGSAPQPDSPQSRPCQRVNAAARRPCNAASKPPTAATASSPRRTPGSADNSPKRSAAFD
ncbi:hypothetical protein [Nonomuraea sp. NPDC049709]|uniref:hypothetical protein n=1 Tax=Nonomuraea sp. NPDC049709 TaxID=3154736 RepID=UPI00343EFB92